VGVHIYILGNATKLFGKRAGIKRVYVAQDAEELVEKLNG
jgi:uroporphyrinogen-III synthase